MPLDVRWIQPIIRAPRSKHTPLVSVTEPDIRPIFPSRGLELFDLQLFFRDHKTKILNHSESHTDSNFLEWRFSGGMTKLESTVS